MTKETWCAVQTALSNTIAQPRTVMIKSLDAILADRAMSTPRWPVDVTSAGGLNILTLTQAAW